MPVKENAAQVKIQLCQQASDALEELSQELLCSKSQIVRYLILHYGKNLK